MFTFHKKLVVKKSMAGIALASIVMASFFVNGSIPSAHADGLAPLTVTAQSEDASKTTLGVGDQLIIALNYQQSFDDLVLDPAGSCTVNNKDVKSSFQNFGDGTFQFVYTVGAGDADAAAGQIPFSCSLKDTGGNQGVVTGFTTPNTLAISASGSGSTGSTGGTDTGGTTGGTDNGGTATSTDTGGTATTTDNGGTTTTGGTTGGDTNGNNGTPPSIGHATVTAIPNTGTLGIGDTLTIDIQQLDQMNDLSMVDSFCKINNVEVNNLQNLGNGHYTFTHTYTSADANIAAGQLTFTCDVKNTVGQTATLHFTSGNSVAIHTQSDETNHGGLPGAGTFQVTVEPTTGTLNPGDIAIIRANDSGGITDFLTDPEGTCTVNGKDVKASFQGFGDHTYQLVYHVNYGDPNVAAGQLAVSCAVKNSAGVTGSINHFTDNNTLVINGGTSTGTDTGGTSTTTSNTGGNTNTGGTATTTDTGNTTGNNNNTGTTTTTNNNTGTTTSTTDGNINGDVQGGTTGEQNGVLTVTGIDQVRSTAVADGTIEHGWKWVFHVTVPSNERNLQLAFDNWMHTNHINSISPANNMRVSSTQANGNNILVESANGYTIPMMLLTDLNPTLPGIQADVTVEMGVPIGSVNGAYSTTYHIKSTAI
jgi:hypothetical protein